MRSSSSHPAVAGKFRTVAKDLTTHPHCGAVLVTQNLAGCEFVSVRNVIASTQDHRHAVGRLTAGATPTVPSHIEWTVQTDLGSSLRLTAKFETLERVILDLGVQPLQHVIRERLGMSSGQSRDGDGDLRTWDGVAHVRKVRTDECLDLRLNVTDRDDVVGSELDHGLNELLVGVCPNWTRQVSTKAILLRFVPASWHDDGFNDSAHIRILDSSNSILMANAHRIRPMGIVTIPTSTRRHPRNGLGSRSGSGLLLMILILSKVDELERVHDAVLSPAGVDLLLDWILHGVATHPLIHADAMHTND